jgi:molybdate transport system ATP-binding protein
MANSTNLYTAKNHTIEADFHLNFAPIGDQSFELDIDFKIPHQGITAIFGESGSGKTSLLRCVAGLETSAIGNLSVDNETWQSSSVFVPTHKRALGYVFQEASLFEHLTVLANLQYAIKRSHKTPSKALFDQVVAVMGIEKLLSQYPEQLSGGEKQRVAISRALLSQPKLLLMDEPLASLDTTRKLEILPYLERLRASFNIPILYVTHSVDEIVRLADYLLILKDGKLQEQGTVTELFSRADLPLGVCNEVGAILECEVLEVEPQWQLIRMGFAGGELWLPHSNQVVGDIQRVRILASDVSLTLSHSTDTSILNVIAGRVVEVIQDKALATSLVRLKVGEHYLLARVTQKSIQVLGLNTGLDIWLQVKSAAIVR